MRLNRHFSGCGIIKLQTAKENLTVSYKGHPTQASQYVKAVKSQPLPLIIENIEC